MPTLSLYSIGHAKGQENSICLTLSYHFDKFVYYVFGAGLGPGLLYHMPQVYRLFGWNGQRLYRMASGVDACTGFAGVLCLRLEYVNTMLRHKEKDYQYEQ
jgi:hypothetical protein